MGAGPAMWRRRRSVAMALGFTVVLTLVIVIARLTRTRPRSGAEDLIAVAPFRVSGADASLAFLGEGLVDLLTTKLTDAVPCNRGRRLDDCGLAQRRDRCKRRRIA